MKNALALAVLFALAAPALADEKEARAILDKAVKAHGGATALAKAARCKRSDAGTIYLQGKPVAFTSQVTNDLPERQRFDVELNKQKITHVLNGEKAYANDGGTTATLQPQRVKELREEAYVDWAITLVPLQKGDVTLASLGKAKVAGEAAVGVKAARKGKPELSLYFSEKTGLLLKVAWRGSMTGVEVDKERQYSAHKEFDGVKWHTKEATSVNGKKFTEFTLGDLTFPAKLDAKTFAKP